MCLGACQRGGKRRRKGPCHVWEACLDLDLASFCRSMLKPLSSSVFPGDDCALSLLLVMHVVKMLLTSVFFLPSSPSSYSPPPFFTLACLPCLRSPPPHTQYHVLLVYIVLCRSCARCVCFLCKSKACMCEMLVYGVICAHVCVFT